MQLAIKNIGLIKNANIKIDNLTIIAGENDNGKSNVGFNLLKSLIKWIMSDRSKSFIRNK